MASHRPQRATRARPSESAMTPKHGTATEIVQVPLLRPPPARVPRTEVFRRGTALDQNNPACAAAGVLRASAGTARAHARGPAHVPGALQMPGAHRPTGARRGTFAGW